MITAELSPWQLSLLQDHEMWVKGLENQPSKGPLWYEFFLLSAITSSITVCDYIKNVSADFSW